MRPDRAQERAIRHFQGPCMVLAGPGSGKTFTIVRRIANLIENDHVRPEEILVLAFNRAASYEMSARFRRLMGGRKLPVTFGTFHGVYFGILRQTYRMTAENILTEEEKYALLRQILHAPELGYEQISTEEREEIGELIAEIGAVKNRDTDPEDYHSARYGALFGKIFKMYEAQRKARRKIDFDDMLLLCRELFQKRPDILEYWQKRFRYILIDEFQDVNRIQYEIIRMLALPENHLFVVGDDDQSIYGFRGADPEIMLGFGKDYPDAKQILLETNYRSGANIVDGAARVIEHNSRRFSRSLHAGHTGRSGIHVQEVGTAKEEALYVMREIQAFVKAGISPDQIAVLYRTGNDAGILAETLTEYQIPFHTRESIGNIYNHFIAGNLISDLRLAAGERSRRVFLDVMKVPKRYISRESLGEREISFEEIRRI